MSVMQPLKDEHQDLLPQVQRLRALAEHVGELTAAELAEGVADAHRFLTGQLIPHAVAEDAVLYPAVARAMGAPSATATMTRDHVEVSRLTEELGRLYGRGSFSGADATALRRVLFGLYALVSVHFAKEEEIYVPVLEEALTPDQAEHLLRDMGHAAHPAHA